MNHENEGIIKLNDMYRTSLCGPIMFSDGVQAVSILTLANLMHLVKNYSQFDDTDPDEEHSYGTFEHRGVKYFWEIEYFDPHCHYSCDPKDPEIHRVLTIMLVSERR